MSNVAGLPSHKHMTFLTMCMNILTFPQWKEISTGVGQPSTSREQEGIRECEDVQISGYGVWTKTAKDEVQTCKVN